MSIKDIRACFDEAVLTEARDAIVERGRNPINGNMLMEETYERLKAGETLNGWTFNQDMVGSSLLEALWRGDLVITTPPIKD